MIAALHAAIAAAQTMKPREFEAAKCRAHREIVYALHGDGRDRLIAINRAYKPVGCGETHADYGSPTFDHLRCDDTPALRALATSINEHGDADLCSGVRVPIIFVIDGRDTTRSYCNRLRAIIEVLAAQGAT